jgi:hypothetical protein
MHVHERVDGLGDRAELLAPGERLGRGGEVAAAVEMREASWTALQAHLQATATHEGRDEAQRGGLQAVAEHGEQVGMRACAHDTDLTLEIGGVDATARELDGHARALTSHAATLLASCLACKVALL